MDIILASVLSMITYRMSYNPCQGRRKQLESGEAKHGVISISIQEVLCSYLIVTEDTVQACIATGQVGQVHPDHFLWINI